MIHLLWLKSDYFSAHIHLPYQGGDGATFQIPWILVLVVCDVIDRRVKGVKVMVLLKPYEQQRTIIGSLFSTTLQTIIHFGQVNLRTWWLKFLHCKPQSPAHIAPTT